VNRQRTNVTRMRSSIRRRLFEISGQAGAPCALLGPSPRLLSLFGGLVERHLLSFFGFIKTALGHTVPTCHHPLWTD
jgi:hypothetical protein